MKKFLLTALLACSSLVVNAVPRQITGNRLVAPSDLAHVELYHDTNHFYVMENGKKSLIENYQLDKELRDIDSLSLEEFFGSEAPEVIGLTEEEAKALLAEPKTILLSQEEFEQLIDVHSGYVKLKKFSDGSYGLSAQIRVMGGGPFFAKFVYWAVKIVAITTIVVAVGVSAAATGGSAFAAISPLLPSCLTGGIVPAATANIAGGLAAAATTATGAADLPVIGSIVSTGVAMAASDVAIAGTAALVGTYGSLGATMAAVEGVATGCALVALGTPTP